MYREVEGEVGMYDVMKVLPETPPSVEEVPVRPKSTLEDRITKIVTKDGITTMGVLVNKLRSFPSQDVVGTARRMISSGKLEGRQGTHKYNKGVIQYVLPSGPVDPEIVKKHPDLFT